MRTRATTSRPAVSVTPASARDAVDAADERRSAAGDRDAPAATRRRHPPEGRRGLRGRRQVWRRPEGDAGRANPRACFMIYAPVTVSAQGNWHGSHAFHREFPNTCVMRDKTGSVFDF